MSFTRDVDKLRQIFNRQPDGFGTDAKTGKLTWGCSAHSGPTPPTTSSTWRASRLAMATSRMPDQRCGKASRPSSTGARIAGMPTPTTPSTYQSALLLYRRTILPRMSTATSPSRPATTSPAFRPTGSRSAPNTPSRSSGRSEPTSMLWAASISFTMTPTQNPKVPAYALPNLHPSYQLTPNVELFGLVQQRAQSALLCAGHLLRHRQSARFPWADDARSFSQGKPFAAFGGVRAEF
jgi:hypothetical protein